jgi:hypothetical protein
VDDYIETYINNCLIWEPEVDIWAMFSDNDFMIQKLDGYHVDHCLLSLDSSITNLYPIFGSNNISETNPLFVNGTNGNFRLEACSPAVNAGNNLIVDTLGILTDLDGNPRIRFTTVDIGAYETQDSCFTSSSQAPYKPMPSASLSPSPAHSGSALTVQVAGFETPDMYWNLRDAYGRSMASGKTLLTAQENFSIDAPASSGIYFVEIRSGIQFIWLKFTVVH